MWTAGTQSITVGYERARGLRAPGERKDGFADDALRERWLPGADLRLRTATSPRRSGT